MHILTINCGSSSLKFQVRAMDRPGTPILMSGEISGIGGPAQWAVNGGATAAAPDVHSHADAVRSALSQLDGHKVDAIAHRVVHGGGLREAVLLDEDSMRRIEAAAELAPLHNGPALAAIRAAKEALPDMPMVAVFDTAFHATLPQKASTYPIDREMAARHGIRHYGFHGLAHQSMAERYALVAGRDPADLKLITLQLGSGCSAAAIRGGRSIDTSMGFTPLEGLMMETRSGDIDPAIAGFLARREGVSIETVEGWLNERSGLMGVAGTRDMRELATAEAAGDAPAALAIEMFVYRVQKYVGAYLVALGGADAIVFGGGIGENAPDIRKRTCEGLHWLGVALDDDVNRAAKGVDARLSTAASAIDIWTLAVDEGVILAREGLRCLGKIGPEGR